MNIKERNLTTLRKDLMACHEEMVKIKEEIKKRKTQDYVSQHAKFHKQWASLFNLVIKGASAAEAAKQVGVSVHNAADKVDRHWRKHFKSHYIVHRDYRRKHGTINTLHEFPPLA